MRQPALGLNRVSQVLLAQNLQARLALNKLCQHGVGAGAWQASVQHFNDHIDVFDALLNRFAREVHVPREPLNCHKTKISL